MNKRKWQNELRPRVFWLLGFILTFKNISGIFHLGWNQITGTSSILAYLDYPLNLLNLI